MAINLLAIALNLFRNNAAIKVLAKKRRPDTSALKKIIETGKAKKLTKRQAKQAEDLEDIADAKYGKSREKGVNLTRLLASVDRTRRKNALRDKVTIVSLKKGKNGNTLMSKSLTYDKTTSRVKIRPHKHVVKQLPVQGEATRLPLSKCKRISFWCDCFTGDSKVLTKEGWRTFYELAEPYVPGYYPIKYSINGVLYNGTAPYYKGRQSVYRMQLSNGDSIDTTKNQKFIWYSGKINGKDRRIWRKLKNLKIGDRLIQTSPTIDYSTTEFNKEFYEAFFIGVLMGDGSLFSDGRPDLQLYKKDAQEIIDIMANAEVVEDIIKLNTREGLRIKFNHRAMEIMNRYKYVNKISVNIQNVNQLMGYVSGLIVTDGSLHKAEVHIHGGKYIQNLQELLIAFGLINVGTILSRTAGTQTNYGISTKNMYMLSIYSNALVKMALHLTEDKANKLQKILNKILKTRVPTTKVKNITYLGQRDVYDITVPNIKRFTVNGGVIAHNCEDFQYRFEYANSVRHGCSTITNEGAEQYPVATNPGLTLGACKHAFVLLSLIRNKNL